ncbi:energy-converting hydrogenase B, subunit C [Methanobrevibacter arboriphilus JCM 13429 = DSM 1125]|uniref:Energy-converting hydrogenase B, subunit C n=1 Tax=Methanobrevibacter arboriphilus JCM 13429 = DSM 1125 TaxID=1300164 RepID=A0A1V6N4Z1_METAZ|nr:hypothetical protein [Methanobrevibacter arboriphilus]OQD59536.1 energy-converting hydrogenase B, subunit C [Methanobrevibacter arboriphilus JCM 13429 = DSM 1125]
MIELLIEVIQSICLIIAAIIVLITAIGILRLDDDIDKVIYARIHMLGMVDIACVLAMIGLGQFLVAGIYFVLAPFLAHAMANAYYYGEDDRNYESDDSLTGKINDNDYNKLAIGKNDITITDSKYKFDSKNNFSGSKHSDSITNVTGNVEDNLTDNVADNLANNVTIKEVSTDDIENSNLNRNTNRNRGKNHD